MSWNLLLGDLGVIEGVSEDIGVRDKRIRDKSPRTKRGLSQDKDKALREFIFIS